MRVVGEVNKYLTVTEPYKMKDESSASASAPCCTSPRSACSTATRCSSPFLPHSANQVWAAFGGKGEFMPMPRIEHVEDLDPDDGAGLRVYPIITGEYSATPPGSAARWSSGRRSPSRPRSSPSSTRRVVEEELARLAGE